MNLRMQIVCQWLLLFITHSMLGCQSFQVLPTAKQRQGVLLRAQFLDLFNGVFGPQNSSGSSQRDSLKNDLLELCAQDKPDRKEMELIIAQLRELSPVTATASSPLLQNEWDLVWTTEKEINFFLDNQLSNQITQSIDGDVLVNNIPFVRGGSFGVVGSLTIPDPQGIRTAFEFEKAILDIGKWGTYTLPPVGKGWFDTVYLDEGLRVDLNSRDDILICRPGTS